MAKSVFRDKATLPDEELVFSAIKSSAVHWNNLITYFFDNYPNATHEWKFYGVAWGWCLVLGSKKQKLVYITPADGFFIGSFIFNDKARAIAGASGFSSDTMQIIVSGKDNTAGHAFDIPVSDETSLNLVKQLLQIKIKS